MTMSTIANSKAVSRVSPSVVRLTYYAGSRSCDGNGTIFSCIRDDEDAKFVSYILTSPKLFGTTHREREEGAVSKLHVWLPTDQLYEGQVMAYDYHMKIVVVKIKSDDALPVAVLTPFTDWISVSPSGVSESHAQLCLSPYPTKLFPGDQLTIVCQGTSHLLLKTGIHSVDRIGRSLDDKPFLRINCEDIIDGAPVINCEGDVIGVAFNVSEGCVAFLPVNIFFKWWKHVLTYGEICMPYMGMSFTNLYAAGIVGLEDIVHDCDVYDGVIIDQVFLRAPADSAGIIPYDVICQCDGRPVRSFLEFAEFMWDKSGEVIEAKGVRRNCHFVWKVEIQAIKDVLVPPILAKSFQENVAERKKSTTKRGKNKAKHKMKAKDRKKSKKYKEKRKMDSDYANERKKGRWNLSKCSNT